MGVGWVWSLTCPASGTMEGMNSNVSLTVLRVVAVLAALVSIVQLTTGLGWAGEASWHGMLGNTAFVLAAVAAVAAFVWSRRSGNKGLFMHAAGMAVIALVQVGLGEMGVRGAHMAIGVLYVVGIIALATLSLRKPGTAIDRNPVDPARLQG